MLLYDLELKDEKLKIFAKESDQYLEDIVENIYTKDIFTPTLTNLSNFSISRPLKKEKAIELLKENKSRYNLNFQILENKDQYFLLAKGPNQHLKHLPEIFYNNAGLSAIQSLKQQLNFPFPKLKRINDTLIYDSNLTMEEFTNLNTAAFDTEFMFWEKYISLEDAQLTDNQIKNFLKQDLKDTTHKEKLKILEEHINNNLGKKYREQPSTLQFGIDNHLHYFEHLSGTDQTYNLKLPSGETKITEHKSDNAKSMVQNFESFLKNQDFDILITQNGMGYDLHQLQKFKENETKSDFIIKRNKPKRGPQVGVFRKVTIPGIYHIDLAPYSQNYFTFTKDNKFETITSLILGEKVEKKESYDDLTRANIEQLLGNNTSQKDYLEYGAEDVTRLLQIQDYIKPIVYLKSKLFKKRPESICFTSKKNLAKDLYSINHLKKHFNTPKHSVWEDYDNTNEKDILNNLLQKNNIKPKTKEGLFNATLYYIAPFTTSYFDLIKRNENIKEIFDYIKNLNIDQNETSTKNTLARFDLISTIEEGYMLPFLYREKEENLQNKLQTSLKKIDKALKNANLINYDGNFFLFPDTQEDTIDEIFNATGFKLARGKTLSFSKNSFILYDGLNTYKKNIDAKGNLGFKTIYQQELTQQLIDITLKQSPKSAIDYTTQFLNDLNNNNLEKEKMIHYKKEILRDFFNYSSPAQRQKRVKAHIEYQLKKGDSFEKAQLKDGWHSLENFLELADDKIYSTENKEFLLQEYLGPKSKNTRNLKEGTIGKYLKPILESEFDDTKKAIDSLESGINPYTTDDRLDLF